MDIYEIIEKQKENLRNKAKYFLDHQDELNRLTSSRISSYQNELFKEIKKLEQERANEKEKTLSLSSDQFSVLYTA